LGDTATVSNPNRAFAVKNVWFFSTGDNTNPKVTATSPIGGCAASKVALTMTFGNEPKGVTNGTGTLEVKDSNGKLIASVDAKSTDVKLSTDSTIVSIALTGLADTTTFTVTVPAGFVKDNSLNQLSSIATTWSFTTGDNTKPTAIITPDAIVNTSDLLTIKFSEKVNSVSGKV